LPVVERMFLGSIEGSLKSGAKATQLTAYDRAGNTVAYDTVAISGSSETNP